MSPVPNGEESDEIGKFKARPARCAGWAIWEDLISSAAAFRIETANSGANPFKPNMATTAMTHGIHAQESWRASNRLIRTRILRDPSGLSTEARAAAWSAIPSPSSLDHFACAGGKTLITEWLKPGLGDSFKLAPLVATPKGQV